MSESRPAWLQDISTTVTRLLAVEGESYPFVVIKQPLVGQAPALCVGFSPEWMTYFVSEDIPLPFRMAILAHEVFEYGHCGGARGSCRRALMYELTWIPTEEWRPYLLFRREQLEHLLGWMTSHPQQYAPERHADLRFNLQLIGVLLSIVA